MIDYNFIKVIINASGLIKIIIDIIIRYYNFLNSIIIDKSWLFILKF